jgi:WD40 repeat protein
MQILMQISFQEPISAISFTSDNQWAVVHSRSKDNNLYILDARTGGWVCSLKGHANNVWSAVCSPGGHYIASRGGDFRVRLWKYDMLE